MAIKILPKGGTESDKLLAKIHKTYGPSIGGRGVKLKNARRIPTGIFPLDLAMGGGFPRGRVSIVFGAEGSGKTNCAMKLCSHIQSHCGVCDHIHEACTCESGPTVQAAVFIDVEHSYDPKWGARMGIDNEELILIQPECAEHAADICADVMRAEDVGICVIDSIAAMTPTKSLEDSVEKAEMAHRAVLVQKMINKVTAFLNIESHRDHYPALLCINQTRSKIGIVYGSPETTPGGNSLRFASSMSVRIHGKEKFDKEISTTLPTYKDTTATLVKWKVPVISKTCEYDFCLLDHDGLAAGSVDDWGTVYRYLSDYQAAGKNEQGQWVCVGIGGEVETYKTKTAIQERYYSDIEFGQFLRDLVVATEMTKVGL